MWDTGVEFGSLATGEDEFVVAESQSKPSGEHVEPLVAVVHARFWCGCPWWVGDLVGVDRGVLHGERCNHESVAPDDRTSNPGVGGFRREEVINPDLELSGERDEEFEARLPFAALQPGERTRRHVGARGQFLKRPAAVATS